ncbi:MULTISPECIES: hypothetical protein [unclassified Kosmotoga]|uniref:hypothetical protein n=1 Tax=unclassified Kosmotoga TaxID=2631489 RepID=UPI0007C4FD71|nr:MULTISPECIES: hypothetical protein [unclassified Kosmotoga]MDI3524187.1 hypothetical protein [Kosmotoga sp.]MDK2953587.1 hypothetical protein [Kosmotoga sp.]OAA22738.1 hypothetical protein DU53_03470 [Kosmotoga sp. DU53]
MIRSWILGIFLIVVGALFLFVPQFGSSFWLVFVWLPGILMEEKGLRKHIPGLLVPAGVLLTVSAVLTVETLFPGFIEAGGWAFFVFAPAFGLLQMYLAGGRRIKGLLVPVGILGGLTIIFLLMNFTELSTGIIIGAALILFGVYTLFKEKIRR